MMNIMIVMDDGDLVCDELDECEVIMMSVENVMVQVQMNIMIVMVTV